MGAIAVVEADSRRREFEEYQTEFFDEDGRRVERLAAKCKSCGQPVRGRRVIRFTSGELQRWKAIDRAAVRLSRLAGLVGGVAVLIGVGLAAWVLLESRFALLGVAAVAGLLGGGGFLVYSLLRIHQAEKEFNQGRAEILRRHGGDIKPKQVGMVGDYYKPHVILPAS